MISMLDSNIHDQPLSGRHQNERHMRETSKFGNFKQSPSDGQSSGPNFEELLGSKENENHDEQKEKDRGLLGSHKKGIE